MPEPAPLDAPDEPSRRTRRGHGRGRASVAARPPSRGGRAGTGAGAPSRTSLSRACGRRGLLSLLAVGAAPSLAGCVSAPTSGTPTAVEATVTVRLRNRDPVEREYEVVVRGNDGVTDRFSGVLPPDPEQSVEAVASFRTRGGTAELSVETTGGRTGRTWDPRECRHLLVEAAVEDGEPSFEARCREA